MGGGGAKPRFVYIQLVLEKVPFLLFAIADCVATVLAQHDSINLGEANFTASWRIGNAFVAYVNYVGQMFYPVRLAAFYPHPKNHLPVWEVSLALTILLAFTIIALAGWRKYPWLAVGWLWYLGMLVPVIGIIQVGMQAHADRYTYLPQIGLCVMLTWSAVRFYPFTRFRQIMFGVMASLVLAALMSAARVQTGYWKNSVALWTNALDCTSDNLLAHDNLSYALTQQGRLNEARQQCEQALKLNPEYVKSYINLGHILTLQNKQIEAVNHLEFALRLDPGNALAHYDLGIALAIQGKLADAIEHYKKAIELKSDYADAEVNLGEALALQGKLSEAVAHYQRALQINSNHAVAHFKLGEALDAQGKTGEAAIHFQRVLQINPRNAEAHIDLAAEMVAFGKVDAAIWHYEQALQIKPDSVEACYNLALTLTSVGRNGEALMHFQEALALAVSQNNPAFVATVRARLDSLVGGSRVQIPPAK